MVVDFRVLLIVSLVRLVSIFVCACVSWFVVLVETQPGIDSTRSTTTTAKIATTTAQRERERKVYPQQIGLGFKKGTIV